MKHCVSLLFAFVLAAAYADSAVISNIVELATLPDNDVSTRKFVVTGTIIMDGEDPILRVGDDGLMFHSQATHTVHAGDTVQLFGTTYIAPSGIRNYFYQAFNLLGHTELDTPHAIQTSRLNSSQYDFKSIRVVGTLVNLFRDDIDTRYLFLVVKCESEIVYAAINHAAPLPEPLRSAEGATVSIAGIYCPVHARLNRKYINRLLRVSTPSDVAILQPAPQDPLDFQELEYLRDKSAKDLASLGQRRIYGTVLAVWQENQMLLRSKQGEMHRVTLAAGLALPRVGAEVVVGGHVRTDFFHINLDHAIYKTLGIAPSLSHESPMPITPESIMENTALGTQVDPHYYGKIVSVEGTVANQHAGSYQKSSMLLDCKKTIIPVDTSCLQLDSLNIEEGCRIRVNGICMFNIGNYSFDTPFPRITGFFIIPGDNNAITILARPPWLTLKKLMAVIILLLTGLVFVFVWNRILNHLVERRSRELFREQISRASAELKVDERTRLAVELHDSLSQDLAAVDFEIAASRRSLAHDIPDSIRHLDIAGKMLSSSRTELKRCLWDLRGGALNEKDLSEAIRKTVAPVLGKTELYIRFNVARNHLSDSTTHSILCIIRELASNAIRHGKATCIHIAGECHDGIVSFSVHDDGTGFDTSLKPGMQDGHFGLSGIQDRVARMNGTFKLDSSPGNGTYARICINLPNS